MSSSQGSFDPNSHLRDSRGSVPFQESAAWSAPGPLNHGRPPRDRRISEAISVPAGYMYIASGESCSPPQVSRRPTPSPELVAWSSPGSLDPLRFVNTIRAAPYPPSAGFESPGSLDPRRVSRDSRTLLLRSPSPGWQLPPSVDSYRLPEASRRSATDPTPLAFRPPSRLQSPGKGLPTRQITYAGPSELPERQGVGIQRTIRPSYGSGARVRSEAQELPFPFSASPPDSRRNKTSVSRPAFEALFGAPTIGSPPTLLPARTISRPLSAIARPASAISRPGHAERTASLPDPTPAASDSVQARLKRSITNDQDLTTILGRPPPASRLADEGEIRKLKEARKELAHRIALYARELPEPTFKVLGKWDHIVDHFRISSTNDAAVRAYDSIHLPTIEVLAFRDAKEVTRNAVAGMDDVRWREFFDDVLQVRMDDWPDMTLPA